jgi:dynein heavy chain 2
MLTFISTCLLNRGCSCCTSPVAGVSPSDSTDPELEAAILAAGADMGLQLTPQQVERMLQLHLACEQRIGIIIMGSSGSGKSTLWQVSASWT